MDDDEDNYEIDSDAQAPPTKIVILWDLLKVSTRSQALTTLKQLKTMLSCQSSRLFLRFLEYFCLRFEIHCMSNNLSFIATIKTIRAHRDGQDDRPRTNWYAWGKSRNMTPSLNQLMTVNFHRFVGLAIRTGEFNKHQQRYPTSKNAQTRRQEQRRH